MPEIDEPKPGNDSVNELYVQVVKKQILYTDDTGWFPIRDISGNQYVMVAYHSSNVILVDPFFSIRDKNRLADYNAIMKRLKGKDLLIDLPILDNECSKEYQANIQNRWKFQFQPLPPDMHRQNAAERAIQTFKAHLLAVLTGVAPDFPRHLWDLLLPQTEMTLNLLRQATYNPSISVWGCFNGKFNYNATPLGPLSISVIVHTKTGRRRSWDFRGKDGWIVGALMTLYAANALSRNSQDQ